MEAKPVFLIKDYEDPKLWAALEELEKKWGISIVAGWNIDRKFIFKLKTVKTNYVVEEPFGPPPVAAWPAIDILLLSQW